MTHARRAAPEAPEVSTSSLDPRRGQGVHVAGVLRRIMAPTAIVGLLAVTTTLTFVPMGGNDTVSVADPLVSHEDRIANRTSREFARVPVVNSLPAALYSPSVVVPTPSPTPSVEAVVATTPAPEPTVVTPTPTPVVAPPVKTTPTVDWSAEGKDVGPRWSSSSVNVRTGPGTGFDVISAIVEGSKITITDVTHDGWQQVSLKSGAGWIKAKFLSETEPVAPTKAAASAAKKSASVAKKPAAVEKAPASTGNAPAPAGQCAKAGNATKNMTKSTVNVLNKVCAQFSGITSYGGYRAGSSGYHGSGRAIDAMISGEGGWDVARWVRANASSLGVVEVIYEQKIWTAQRSGDGWRSMSDRGSASANHYDHVHISVA